MLYCDHIINTLNKKKKLNISLPMIQHTQYEITGKAF